MKNLFKLELDGHIVSIDEKKLTHKSYRIIEQDIEIILRALKDRLDFIDKMYEDLGNYTDSTCDPTIDDMRGAIGHEHYDLQGLIGMFKEQDAVELIISKENSEKGWSWEHNVDMPYPYFKYSDIDSDHKSELVKSVPTPKKL